MRRFFTKTKALATLLPFLAVVFAVPHTTQAFSVTGAVLSAADSVVGGATKAFFEVLILPFAAAIMALAGNLMDAAISFSLHTAYIFSLSPAIDLGWVIVRDIANIFFIFVLIYISIGTILKSSGFQTKKLLKDVIIAALLINFSMFFTKAIIDVSNVFGNWLYGGIEKTLIVNTDGYNPATPGDHISLAGLIADRLGILKYWSSGQSTNQQNSGSESFNFTNSLIRLGIVSIATYVFAYCAVLFMARSIELLLLLVFAPIGFVGGLLPQTAKYAKEWWSELLTVAVFPVAFLLMLYIALQFINGLGAIQTTFKSMTSPLVIAGFPIMTYFQYFIIIFLLQACLKIAKENSGKVGDALGGVAKQLGTLAVGASMGGLGLAGRQIVGRTASRLAQDQGFQTWAGKSWFGEQALKGTRGVAGSSFDLRATSTFKNTIGKNVEAGEAGGKGGFDKYFEEKTEAKKKFGDSLSNDTKDRYGVPIAGGAAATARNQYVERLRTTALGGGIPSKLGGTASVISTVLGRGDRVAGAQMIGGLMNDRKKEIAELTAERNQLRKLQDDGGALTAYQQQRLNGTGGGSIADDMQTASDEVARLKTVADTYTQVAGRNVKAKTVEKTEY